MSGSMVRIEKIEIKNFKNVKHGLIDLGEKIGRDEPSILGIYGQNGSGKTAVVEALALLKQVMMGEQIPSRYFDYINDGENRASFDFEFYLSTGEKEYILEYGFDIIKHNTLEAQEQKDKGKGYLLYEELNYTLIQEGERNKRINLIEVGLLSESMMDLKLSKVDLFSNIPKEILTFQAKSTLIDRKSYLFSKECFEMAKEFANPESMNSQVFLDVMPILFAYAHQKLNVITVSMSNSSSMNQIMLFLSKEGEYDFELIDINSSYDIPMKWLPSLAKKIEQMNIVLSQIIPGLEIEIEELTQKLNQKMEKVSVIELIAHKKGVRIPLRYESEGIKKIISILPLLIEMYNDSSVSLVIDELDAGIFEYLLGEILEVLSQRGQGQLIFTSHNLRPLEVIDDKYLLFTTTNPTNRYMTLQKDEESFNLRSHYFRDIFLGISEDGLYEDTKSSAIKRAFRKAGQRDGK